MTLIKHWQTLTPREQRSVSFVASVLGLLLVWFIAIAPALTTVQESSLRRDQVAQQHAHLLGLQAKAQALQTQTPLARDEALRRLQSISAMPGLQLKVQAERVNVQLNNVPAPVLAQWLMQARTQTQTLPLEAHLTRSTSTPNNTNATAAATVAWDGQLVMRLPSRHTTP